MELEQLIEDSWRISEEHGFHQDQHDGSEYDTLKLTLTISELIEAFEEIRDGHAPDEIYWKCKECGTFQSKPPPTTMSGITTHYVRSRDSGGWIGEVRCEGVFKPEGVPIEIADAVIRIADYVRLRGIPLVQAIQIKQEFNSGRPFMHGRKF